MTHEEAKNLKTFKSLCTCGGYAWSLNGRPEAQPHMPYCPQRAEYAEWFQAMYPVERKKPDDTEGGTCD